MLVGLTGKLRRQSLATTRWVVWSLIVREQLALSIDFCMNLLILNGCMNFGNDEGHDLLKQPLSQKAYPVHEWWIPCTHVELVIDWLSWTLSLWSHISIYLVLGCRRALWFKANLSQIWGRLLGKDKRGKTNNSHTKICQKAANKSCLKKEEISRINVMK